MKRVNSDLPKMSAPAQRALQSAGIATLKQLTNMSEAELMQLHGMGPNALGKLREALKANGLVFRESKKEIGMDKIVRTHLDNILLEDGQVQFKAYNYLMKVTEQPVDWAYEAWDELVSGLTHKDNHVRTITSQILTHLAKNDPKGRIFKDYDKLINVTKDDRFVTARHCMQSLWNVGVVGKKQQKLYMDGMEKRFKECVTEKNGHLIRYDILVSMRNVYNEVGDESIREKAQALIASEKDVKNQKKCAGVWKK
jgi:hypothetical protein